MGGRVYQVHDEMGQDETDEIPIETFHPSRPPRRKAFGPPRRHDLFQAFRVCREGRPPAEIAPEASLRRRKGGAQEAGPRTAPDHSRTPPRPAAFRARASPPAPPPPPQRHPRPAAVPPL